MNATPQHLGTLVSRDGHELALTTDDALWMARACVGEGARDTVAVTSCMLRRWAFVTDTRAARGAAPLWDSLTELVVGREPDRPGYSQPVAWQWRDRGAADRQARRARIRAMRWTEIPEGVRTQVLQLLSGRRSLQYPGAVHFADRPTSAQFITRTPGARRVGGGANVFLSVPGSRDYPEPQIRPGPGAAGPDSSPRGPLLAGGAVLAMVVML